MLNVSPIGRACSREERNAFEQVWVMMKLSISQNVRFDLLSERELGVMFNVVVV